MAKKEERLAKKIIKEELQEVTDLVEALPEERIMFIEGEIQEVIDEIEEEQSIESYYKGLGRTDLLKAKMIRMFCSGVYTARQISQSLRVPESTIRSWLADEDVREVIEKVQRDEDAIMAAQLRSLRRIAIEKQLELITDAENEMVSAIMIKDVLDRTGHKPVEKKEIAHNVTYEERLQEIAQGIEVEYTVVDDGTCAEENIISTEGEDISD